MEFPSWKMRNCILCRPSSTPPRLPILFFIVILFLNDAACPETETHNKGIEARGTEVFSVGDSIFYLVFIFTDGKFARSF